MRLFDKLDCFQLELARNKVFLQMKSKNRYVCIAFFGLYFSLSVVRFGRFTFSPCALDVEKRASSSIMKVIIYQFSPLLPSSLALYLFLPVLVKVGLDQ